LRRDFSFDLPLDRRIEGDLRAIERQVVAEISHVVEETGNLAARADRHAIGEHDMKPNSQVGQPARARDGVRDGRCADHEACRTQNAAPVRFFDGGVDRFAEAEVVRRDDQPVQCARSSRLCMEKNSPASPSRIVMCAVPTISLMIGAIVGADVEARAKGVLRLEEPVARRTSWPFNLSGVVPGSARYRS
jgi:hypothetical protein